MRKLPVTLALSHVLRSTRSNIGFAWFISWPWMLVLLPVDLAASVIARPASGAPDQMTATAAVASLLVGLLSMFAFSSIAVNWHRYILRDERPHGAARLRADNTVWRYFGNTLLIIAIVGLCFLPVAFLTAAAIFYLGNAGLAIAVPLYLAALLVSLSSFYRLSVKLPAIALERRDYGLRNAWEDTRGNHWQLVGVALNFFLLVLGLALIIFLAGAAGGATSLGILSVFVVGIQLLVNWFGTIVAVTLLTSLYGFFAEKRDF